MTEREMREKRDRREGEERGRGRKEEEGRGGRWRVLLPKQNNNNHAGTPENCSEVKGAEA